MKTQISEQKYINISIFSFGMNLNIYDHIAAALILNIAMIHVCNLRSIWSIDSAQSKNKGKIFHKIIVYFPVEFYFISILQNSHRVNHKSYRTDFYFEIFSRWPKFRIIIKKKTIRDTHNCCQSIILLRARTVLWMCAQ